MGKGQRQRLAAGSTQCSAATIRGVRQPHPQTAVVPRPFPTPLPGGSPYAGPDPLPGQHGCRERPHAPRQQEEGEAGLRGAHTPQFSKVRAGGSSAANRTGPDRAGPSGYPGPSASRRATPQRSPQRLTEGRRRSKRTSRRSLTLLQGLQRASIAHQVLLLALAALRRRHLTRRWPRGTWRHHKREAEPPAPPSARHLPLPRPVSARDWHPSTPGPRRTDRSGGIAECPGTLQRLSASSWHWACPPGTARSCGSLSVPPPAGNNGKAGRAWRGPDRVPAARVPPAQPCLAEKVPAPAVWELCGAAVCGSTSTVRWLSDVFKNDQRHIMSNSRSSVAMRYSLESSSAPDRSGLLRLRARKRAATTLEKQILFK